MSNQSNGNHGSKLLQGITWGFAIIFVVFLVFLIIKLTGDAEEGYEKYANEVKKTSYQDRIKDAQKEKLAEEHGKREELQKLRDYTHIEEPTEEVKQNKEQIVKEVKPEEEQIVPKKETGLQKVTQSDYESITTKAICLACHSPDNRLVGPSFKEIAEEYKGQLSEKLLKTLLNKVKKGSAKSMEEGYTSPWIAKGYPPAMPPNTIPEEDIKKILTYMLYYR